MFVTLNHLHSMPGTGVRPGWCHSGARARCQRLGLDWRAIVRDGGIDADALMATGDAMAIALVEYASSEDRRQKTEDSRLPARSAAVNPTNAQHSLTEQSSVFSPLSSERSK